MKIRRITPLLAAAGAVAALAAAPIALADPGDANAPESCVTTGIGTQCATPGNVQINDSPPVNFAPQYPYWEGDLFGFGGGYHVHGHR
jgi:hypothetical protein